MPGIRILCLGRDLEKLLATVWREVKTSGYRSYLKIEFLKQTVRDREEEPQVLQTSYDRLARDKKAVALKNSVLYNFLINLRKDNKDGVAKINEQLETTYTLPTRLEPLEIVGGQKHCFSTGVRCTERTA